MCNKVLLSGIFFLILALFANGQGNTERNNRRKLNEVIDSILQSQVDLDKIPGAVIIVKKDEKLVSRKAYGLAKKYDFNHEVSDPPEKMRVRHMFDIASLTKVIGTTTAIMLLTDKGLMSVDDPVFRYIKAFDTPEKSMITIRHLLTHTAGLYEWYPLYYRASQKEECYRLIGELPLKYPVGEQRRYSDLGFVLLGEIIEIVSGMPLEEYMKQNVFQPLGMKKTAYNPLRSGSYKKIAATSAGNPYEKRMVYDSTLGFTVKEIDPVEWDGWRNYLLKGEVNDGNAWYANGGISGAAGLFSTASDLQRLADMLISKGQIGSKQLISSGTIEKFLSKDDFNNGLGWMMDTSNSFMKNAPEGSFGHTGFTGTSMAIIPDEKISVILLINRQNTGLDNNGDYYNVNPVRLHIFSAVLKYLTTEN